MLGFRILLVVFFISSLIGQVSAICDEVPSQDYPDFMKRYTGNVSLSGFMQFEDFNITVVKLYDYFINVKIKKDNIPGYFEGKPSINSPDDDYISNEGDIRIVYHGPIQVGVSKRANISVYTLQRARLNVNITNVDRDYSSQLGTTVPSVRTNQTFTADIIIKNVGELEADNIAIIPIPRNFTVIEKEGEYLLPLCPDSTHTLSYKIKAPGSWNISNFTFSWAVNYSDMSPKGPERKYFDIINNSLKVVGGPELKITRNIIYPWDNEKLGHKKEALIGEKVTVQVNITNQGKVLNFNGKTREYLEKGLEFISGDTKWEGSLSPGNSVFLNYFVTSGKNGTYNVSSIVEYHNEAGFTFFVNETASKGIEFGAPRPRFSIGRWVNNTEIDDLLHVNSTNPVNITVVLKNNGTRDAYRIGIRETSEMNLSASQFNLGHLHVDKTFNYSYILRGREYGRNYLNTAISFRDNTSGYKSNLSSYVFVDAPKIELNFSFSKILDDIKLDVTVWNVGSLWARDVEVEFDFPQSMNILKGNVIKLPNMENKTSTTFTYTIPLPEKIGTGELYYNATVRYQDTSKNKFKTVIKKSILKSVLEAYMPITVKGISKLDIGKTSNITVKIENKYGKNVLMNLSVDVPEGLIYNSRDGLKYNSFNLSKDASFEYNIPLKGATPGSYIMKLTAEFDGRSVTYEFPVTVKGPDITISRSISSPLVTAGEEVVLEFIIKNNGDTLARNILLIQDPAPSFQTRGENVVFVNGLGPGERKAITFSFVSYETANSRFPDYYLYYEDQNGRTFNMTGIGESITVTGGKVGNGVPDGDNETEPGTDWVDLFIMFGPWALVILLLAYIFGKKYVKKD